MSAVSPLNVAVRATALWTAGPSMFCTLNLISCCCIQLRATTRARKTSTGGGGQLLTGHRRFLLAILVAAVLSLATDTIILTAVASFFVNSAWPDFTRCVVAIGVLKRTHSFATVYMAIERVRALRSLTARRRGLVWAYMAGYTVLTVTTAAAQGAAYYAVGWDSAAARASWLFVNVYRPVNIITVLYFAGVAIYSDIHFLLLSHEIPVMSARFDAVKEYYNAPMWITYELVVTAYVVCTLFAGVFVPDMVSGFYGEQLLLSIINLNAWYIVKAATTSVSSQALSESSNHPHSAHLYPDYVMTAFNHQDPSTST